MSIQRRPYRGLHFRRACLLKGRQRVPVIVGHPDGRGIAGEYICSTDSKWNLGNVSGNIPKGLLQRLALGSARRIGANDFIGRPDGIH